MSKDNTKRKYQLPPHLEAFTLDELPNIRDGVVGRMFEQAMLAASRDLDGAPDIRSARKITLTVALKPLGVDDSGNLQGVVGGFKIKTSFPEREAVCAFEIRHVATTEGGVRQRVLAFNPSNPVNPNQLSLDLEDEPGNDKQ